MHVTRYVRFLICFILFVLVSSHLLAGENFFDSGGVKIHYLDEGAGEPVLLIHGFNASARTNWGLPGVIRNLTPHYRVIAMDCRGHGQSDKPTEVQDYGVKMVEDVIALLDHLKIEKAHIVGYSMGGMITMKLLATHPERVKSAVVGGMGWFHTRWGQPLRLEAPGTLRGAESSSREACFKGFLALQVSEEEIKAIKTPMTILIGENDPIRKRYVQPLMKIRPDIPVVVLDKSNHLSAIRNAEFKDSIRTFLDGQAGSKK